MDKFTNFGIMKLRILVILFFPFSLFSQDFNQKNIKYEDDIDSLIIKHQEINYLIFISYHLFKIYHFHVFHLDN